MGLLTLASWPSIRRPLRFFIALFGCIIIVALLPPLRRPSPPSPSTPSQPPELSDSTPEPELIPQEPSVNFRNDFNRVTSIPASRFQPIPKRIWTFWDGNEDDIPWMITAMMKGWSFHNPSYNITVICSSKVWDYLSTPLPHNFWDGAITRQQKANWVRLAILSEHGGFWIDASTIITGSLDYILDRQRHQQTEAFAFYLDYFTLNKAIPVYETYFLATIPHGQWISAWFNEYNMVFSNFGCRDEYLDYLRYMHGDSGYNQIVQNINDHSYLKLAIASQRVLTFRNIPLPDRQEAVKIPYKLLEESGYDDWEYARNLLMPIKTGQEISLAYKMRMNTRVAIDEILAGRTTMPVKDSLFGRFVLRFGDIHGVLLRVNHG